MACPRNASERQRGVSGVGEAAGPLELDAPLRDVDTIAGHDLIWPSLDDRNRR